MANSSESSACLARVQDLTIRFSDHAGTTLAVNRVSLEIAAGETVALVGESGCGKSVTALSLSRLLPVPPAEITGTINVCGVDVVSASRAELRRLRRERVAYVFQEPSASLNPVYTVGFQLREAFPVGVDPTQRDVADVLQQVGIADPERCLSAYPHQLSGGMQQRVVIGMALASRPQLIVADEPTTALDVTIQAQVLELLNDIREQRGMAMLLIAHNLGLVADMADRIYVMYAGHIIERGATRDVLRHPRHPYTRGLIDAVPRLRRRTGALQGIPGSVPIFERPPTVCVFRERCPHAKPACSERMPPWSPCDDGSEHAVRCCYPLADEPIVGAAS